MPDIFISYSRRDADFVRKLHEKLAAEGRDIWVDWEDIPVTADWLEEIYSGIQQSDTFLFVISPDSVQSEVCGWELKYAVENNKRFVPIVYREIIEQTDKDAMHPAITSHNWLFFREQDDFDATFKTLTDAIDTDLSHVREHTRLLVRAKEWDNKNHSASFVLSGDELREAEDWLAHASSKTPRPTDLHFEYILESRKVATRRQRTLALASLAAAAVSILLAIVAFFSWIEANEQRDRAEEQRDIAQIRQNVSDSLALAANAQLELSQNNNDRALQLALAANEVEPSYGLDLSEEDAESIRELAGVQLPPLEARRVLEDVAYGAGTRMVLDEHGGGVNAVNYSPDGSRIVSAGVQDFTAIIWDAETGDVDLRLAGHENFVLDAVFSPDGSQVLTGSYDGTACLWDAETGGAPILCLDTGGPWVRSVAFNPADPTKALIASEEGVIRYWDMEDDAVLFTLVRELPEPEEGEEGEDAAEVEPMTTAHGGQIDEVNFNAEGTLAVSVGRDSHITLWDMENDGAMIWDMDADDVPTGAEFTPDSRFLLTSTGAFDLVVRSVASGASLAEFKGHIQFVQAVALSADGLLAVSVGNDQTLRMWDFNSGDEVYRFAGHTDSVRDVDFSPDGTRAATASLDGTVRIWDLTHGEQLMRLDGHSRQVIAAALEPDGTQGFSAGWDNNIIVWDLENGEGRTISIPDIDLSTTTFSAAGDRALVGTESGPVLLLDMASEETVTFAGHEGVVTALAFNPDETRAITGSLDGGVFLWDLSDPESGIALEGHDNIVNGVSFSPDGAEVVSADGDGLVIVWDAETGEERRRANFAGDPAAALFTPDGSGLLLSIANRPVLVDPQSFAEIVAYEGHGEAVGGRVAFNPDGQFLVTGSPGDRTIRLWDVATGDELYRINTNLEVRSVSVSADGTRALVGFEDRSVRLWDITPPTLDETRAFVNANRYVPTDDAISE